MSLRQQLSDLIRAGEQGVELYTLINPWNSRRTFAAFAYLAEQYGYRYAGLSPAHGRSRSYPVFAFRRLPDAAERAARTTAAFPDALHGGPLPGVQARGRTYTPLPEARREVDLLHARIKVDLYGPSGRKRIQVLLLAVPVGLVIALAVNGSLRPTTLAAAGGVTLAFYLYLWLAAAIMRRRHEKYRTMLEQAGITWPPQTPAA